MAEQELARQPVAVKAFFDACADAQVSVNKHVKRLTAEAAREVLASSNIVVPTMVDNLLAKFHEDTHGKILDAVLTGMQTYKAEHGHEAPPDFVEFALFNALRTATPLKTLMLGDPKASAARFDNATNLHHDNLSLQPGVAMVAIMAQFAEAIPFAAYLPAELRSNEARLAIMSNKAQSNWNEYLDGASLDGIAGGSGYLDSERICLLSTNGGGGTALTYTVTAKHNPTTVGGVAVAGDNPAVPLLRARTELYVNGLFAARETENYGSGSNTIAGSITISGTAYALSGTVNSDTGAISITSSPALPAGTILEAVAHVDYEKAPQYTPSIGTDVTVYKMFARASRGRMSSTIDAMTQMAAELQLDPRGQAMLSLRAQFAQELHYGALRKAKRIAANQPAAWNYGYSTQIAQKDWVQIWLNLLPILEAESQKMANVTIDHGINTLYLTGTLAAQAQGLPSTIWEPSGITARPGVYRMGRLAGKYECYYTPRHLTQAGDGSTSEILAIGRATNTARNMLVRGEAVPPVIMPLGLLSDLVTGDGFYCRQFTSINPHEPSARSASLISVTNINT